MGSTCVTLIILSQVVSIVQGPLICQIVAPILLARTIRKRCSVRGSEEVLILRGCRDARPPSHSSLTWQAVEALVGGQTATTRVLTRRFSAQYLHVIRSRVMIRCCRLEAHCARDGILLKLARLLQILQLLILPVPALIEDVGSCRYPLLLLTAAAALLLLLLLLLLLFEVVYHGLIVV